MEDLIIVGDRVLILPDEGEQQTQSGLVLPATVAERERVRIGRVVRVGPGYLLPNPDYTEGEPWAAPRSVIRYLPLQARPGDLAYFLRKEAIDLQYMQQDYVVIPHSAILALVRPDPSAILENLDTPDGLDDLLE